MAPVASPAGLDPLPGDQSTAADLPALTGGGGGQPAQPGANPDVQASLRTAVGQLRDMHQSLDSVADKVKAIATTFPTQSQAPAQVGQLIDALKKALTTLVMDAVKQAPAQPNQAGPTVAR